MRQVVGDVSACFDRLRSARPPGYPDTRKIARGFVPAASLQSRPMKVDLFNFDLPPSRIAQAPARPRDSARLLHVRTDGGLEDRTVRDLPALLSPGDVMVFNNTRVIPARLSGHRKRVGGPVPGPRIEVTLRKNNGDGTWQAFARPARKLVAEDVIAFAEDFRATVLHKAEGGEITLDFPGSPDHMMSGLVTHGIMPLPPYIARDHSGLETDDNDYQTIYAKYDGAVAAPTAGLHFTDRLMEALDQRGVNRTFLTLHVGAGTFLPVTVDDTADHHMHAEWGEISPESAKMINTARRAGGQIISVGTTSLRLLESASGKDGQLRPFSGDTDIFITPGYRFRTVDALMTNFHLPRSTLFMLVSAFAGLKTMQGAYRHAIEEGYRFYSYGDSSFLELNKRG